MSKTLPSRPNLLLASTIFLASYVLTAWVSFLIPSPMPPITPLWLPTGVSLVAVLITGTRLLPIVFLVSTGVGISWVVLMEEVTANNILAAIAIGAGALLEVTLASNLIHRLEPQRDHGVPEFIERSTAFGFIAAIAVASTLSATVGTAIGIAVGGLPPSGLAYAWLLWWGGNAVGGLVVCAAALPWLAPLFANNELWKRRRFSLDISMALLISAMLAAFVYSWENNKIMLQNRIAERGNAVQDSLQRTFDSYLDTLTGLESYFQSSQFVDRNEFTQFTSNYISRLSGLRSIAWAPRANDGQLDELISAAKKDGIDNYQLRSYATKQPIVPSGTEHFPLFYAVPDKAGKQVIGLDLLTDPKRSAAVRSSIEQRTAVATVPITLVEDSNNIPGLLVVNAIYPAESGPDSPPLGIGMLAMQVGKVVHSSLKSIDFNHLKLHMYDQNTGQQLLTYNDQHQLNYDEPSKTTRSIMPLNWEYKLPIAGQNWLLELQAQPTFATSLRSWDNYLILIIGFILSAIIAVFQLLSTGYTSRMERMVKARTAQLSETNDELRDVAEQRKQARDKLQKQTQELTRSNQELQQFAYIASHDLQEPLRSINGFATLLQNRYGNKLDQSGNEYINFISEGSERMRQIIVDLLTYSRAGSKQLQPTLIDVNEIVEGVKSNLAASITENGADIIVHEMPKVSADAQQFTLLFQNLIGNAIKYRSTLEHPKINITAEREKDAWVFAVADNGIGIKPEHHEQIFEIFKRLHSTVYYKGTGIGLAICKRVTERHGGKLWLESEEGKGCTFFFTLPDQLPDCSAEENYYDS